MIVALAEGSHLQWLYTQNIDRLDTQLPLLKTLIPLPEEELWPVTIQLYRDLRTIWYQMYPYKHLSCFDLVLFIIGSLLPYIKYEEDELLNRGRRRARAIPIMRPRIWLYSDFDYPDTDAIDKVIAIDLDTKLDIVIVVGTMLKVESAKALVWDIYHIAHKDSRFTT